MRILLAPDSFKECLSATAVCEALTQGIRAVLPDAEITSVPMADGGEGTLEALLAVEHAETRRCEATDPVGRKINSSFAWLPDTRTAFIETAAACGLELLTKMERNPLVTSTRGAGELFREALTLSADRIVLTIGGSATVDGGTGVGRALGYQFLDGNGNELPEGGGSLAQLAKIVPPENQPWQGRKIIVACDVDNPLLGKRGASAVFGPQKGATRAQVDELDAALANFATRLRSDLNLDVADLPGAGAAGGMGAGLMAMFGAKLVPGVDVIMDVIGLRRKMKGSDLVISGEGRTDFQTAYGKVCVGVAKLAAERRIPCVVLSGALKGDLSELYDLGITAVFSISPGPRTLEQAFGNAQRDLAVAAENVMRLIGDGKTK